MSLLNTIQYRIFSEPSGLWDTPVDTYTLDTKDGTQIITLILYRSYIPIELRKIVHVYMGDESETEPIHAWLANQLYSRKLEGTPQLLPPINLQPKFFTGLLQYIFDLKFHKSVSGQELTVFTIKPEIFYKYYKMLDSIFEPRIRNTNITNPVIRTPVRL